MTTDPAELVEQADSAADLAERGLEGRRREADSIRDALRDARDGLERARVGLRALAAMERDEDRESGNTHGVYVMGKRVGGVNLDA